LGAFFLSIRTLREKPIDNPPNPGYNRIVLGKKALPFVMAAVLMCVLTACGLFTYGQLGGADQTGTYFAGDSRFDAILASMSGVWYSHYAGTGRLDGYRIGRWSEFDHLMKDSDKTALFPNLPTSRKTYTESSGTIRNNKDYFVFYDDTVFGQSDDDTGGNGGWDGLVTRYIGIVRAVNIFNGDPSRGAIIIEYLQNAAPLWDKDIRDGQRPFFGIYYRVLGSDIVQMANAVDLAALYRGKKYYTETAALDEAVVKNTVENEAEFISWGVVIPQDREK
jgi:hypothetical protein